MKKWSFTAPMLALGLALALTGCRGFRRCEVLQESYVHKYGVPVAKEDFCRNGKNGLVVQLLESGVSVTREYAEGVLQGKTFYTFPHSSVVARVELYEKGSLISKTENYQSGAPLEEERYREALPYERLRWYEDGTPAAVEELSHGLIVSGEYRSMLNEIKARVVDGKGTRLLFAGDGELLYKDAIEGGEMVERIAYLPSGEPSSITPYKGGAVHGTRLTFLPGGLPSTQEEWVQGQQEGTTIVFHCGEKVSEVSYIRGKKEGIERRFRDGKIVVEEVSWKRDVQHGPRKIIIDENNIKTEWFQQGEVVSRTTYERMNPTR